MAIKTFGKIKLYRNNTWILDNISPHVCIKLKSIFPKIPKGSVSPFKFENTPENCFDLLWFMERYPLVIDKKDSALLENGKKAYIDNRNELEQILLPNYKYRPVKLKDGYTARDYQIKAAEVIHKTKRILIGDDIGLGKTMIGILSMLHPGTLPCVVCVQTHLPQQWKSEIEKFTDLQVHIIKKTQPYSLPIAYVYIMKYSTLRGWVDMFSTGIFKMGIFDEIQELRRIEYIHELENLFFVLTGKELNIQL